MKALILAGGFGTRLKPLSCTRPKTLFPIVNKPLLQLIFERLIKNDIGEAILAVNSLTAFHIAQQCLPTYGLKVKYSRDPKETPLGTGGPIKKAEKLVGNSEPFLVLNGDILAELSYREILEKHEERGNLATIALHEIEDPSRYGVAELAEKFRIKKFIEKPPKDKAPTNLINAGIYVLSPKIFSYIPKGRAISMEREIFPKLVKEGELYGHIFKDLWMDIGKPEEYLQANKAFLDSFAKNQKNRIANGFKLVNPVAFDEGVRIEPKSIIGPYAILGKNVTVGNKVQISESVILSNVKINEYSKIKGAIIGESVIIGKNVTIGKGCIIGDHVKIKDNISFSKKTIICPSTKVNGKMLKSKIIC